MIVLRRISPGFEKDELAMAQQVAAHFGFCHHTVEPVAFDLADEWRKLINIQEEPIGSASVFAQFKTFEAAAQQGTVVLLDGQGADETLAGYNKYYKWYWQELFQKENCCEVKKSAKPASWV
ncbi:MAG: asparagine synthase C-terminal domain-containing protein [Chitinophagaceae bacterium]|nr:asparagine synthase C-terminal domain-containing protein [Chitinophagaceae bacterium]